MRRGPPFRGASAEKLSCPPFSLFSGFLSFPGKSEGNLSGAGINQELSAFFGAA